LVTAKALGLIIPKSFFGANEAIDTFLPRVNSIPNWT
jgi:hypothetical protein